MGRHVTCHMLLIKSKYEHMLVDPQIGKYLNTV